jgi:thiamine biosynthesis lipoprotein
VSPDTVTLVDALVRSWHATGGAFDPSLLGALVGLGYQASRDDAVHRTSLAPDIRPVGNVGSVRIDAEHGIVQLPVGTALDPGGIGKGLAGDLIGRELLRAGASGTLIEVGGDVMAAGTGPSGEAWRIAVDDPFDVSAPTEVRLTTGGVATSSSRLRTWKSHDIERHHLLDPATQTPTDGDVVACTVVAGTAAWAEAFTKVAFVDGCEHALARYAELGLAARVTTSDGAHHTSPNWEEFVR